METDSPIKLRRVSRVVLLSPRNRILMFDSELAYTRVWLCPGGGLEEGEEFEEGARRELEEETGLRDIELSGPIWTVEFKFQFNGVIYDQRERYFVGRSGSEDISMEGWTETEAGEIKKYRWWSVDEIRESGDDFRPAELSELLPAVLMPVRDDRVISVSVERGARTR